VKIFENRLRINTVTAMSSVSPFVGTRRMGILRVSMHIMDRPVGIPLYLAYERG